jgi:hypothetical protein
MVITGTLPGACYAQVPRGADAVEAGRGKMESWVCPELPTASRARVRGLRHARAAVDNSAPFTTCPESTYKSGKAVQTNGATSIASPANTITQYQWVGGGIGGKIFRK